MHAQKHRHPHVSMSFTGAVPAYSFASAPADAGALYSAAGRDARGDVFAQAATGDAFGRSSNIYDSYYGPAPAGLQNVDVMGHIARTNLTLPAYYQVRARAKSQNRKIAKSLTPAARREKTSTSSASSRGASPTSRNVRHFLHFALLRFCLYPLTILRRAHHRVSAARAVRWHDLFVLQDAVDPAHSRPRARGGRLSSRHHPV